MKRVYDNVIAAIGNTPMVRLNHLGRETGANFYAKLEYLNPGNSIKDRISVQMVDDAVAEGRLKPGGTIVECTSGNTGLGLAIVAGARGFKAILVMPDKVSEEKIKALRSFGAKVITTPTAVAPDDPRSYYSVADRIARETPNCVHTNQYHNQSNPEAHYRSTGPEIWEQLGEAIDAVVVATGTGGTISGLGRYLKEKKPSIRMVMVDPIGSILHNYFKTGKISDVFKTYMAEGFGEDFIPSALDVKMIDDSYQVSDKECFLTARELTRKEGLWTGGSGGGAVCAAIKFAREHPECKNIVIILPDSGSRYLSKVFDDDWLRENSFLDEESRFGTLSDVVAQRKSKLVSATGSDSFQKVIRLMKKHGISQMPVLDGDKLLGIVSESDLLEALLNDPHSVDRPVADCLDQDYVVVPPDTPVVQLAPIFAQGKIALVEQGGSIEAVVTKIDLIDHLAGLLG